jgi:hypothetical protein
MGYASSLEIEQKAMTIEGQFELLVTFLTKVKPKALAAMRKRDWEALKLYYNGSGKNDWAAEIAQIYRRLLADRDPKKSIQKGNSRIVNSQVVDVVIKGTTAAGAEASSNVVINNTNTQTTDLTTKLTEQLTSLDGIKNQADQIKDIVAKTADQVSSVANSSIITGEWLTWIIIGIFILSIIPNLRALYTYLDDNGFLPNKYNLSKLFKLNE